MTFDEKMQRNAPEDQIELGQIVDDALKGNFGYLFKCIISGEISELLEKSRANPQLISAERALGRIEALDMLTERLDIMVDIKNQLLAEKKEQDEIKTGEQSPPKA